VIPNALGTDQFPISNDHPTTQLSNCLTILHVGRMERVKGIHVLADAIPQVIQQVPNARFVFVGEDRPALSGGSQRAELETQFTRAGVRHCVEFTGAVDHAALSDWYRRADIGVVPSMLYESFSYTCAQAMAAGKPVIATRIGGIPETVDDGVNGIIVTAGSVEELTEAILRLARDPDLRARMGRAGRAKVEREFDSIQVARRNLQVYKRAAHAFGPTAR
jgi:glycosyltransferase involved in cell wall biosynthesis